MFFQLIRVCDEDPALEEVGRPASMQLRARPLARRTARSNSAAVSATIKGHNSEILAWVAPNGGGKVPADSRVHEHATAPPPPPPRDNTRYNYGAVAPVVVGCSRRGRGQDQGQSQGDARGSPTVDGDRQGNRDVGGLTNEAIRCWLEASIESNDAADGASDHSACSPSSTASTMPPTFGLRSNRSATEHLLAETRQERLMVLESRLRVVRDDNKRTSDLLGHSLNGV